MKNYVITLEPNPELKSRIRELKKIARNQVGNQLYLNSTPHLTLYAGTFEEFEKFKTEFEQIKDSILKPQIEIIGWKVFDVDPVTQGTTLVCELNEENKTKLREIQNKVVSLFNKHRSTEIPTRYEITSDDEQVTQNLKLFGFPFIGDNWEPHFTIASFKKEDFQKVWQNIESKSPKGFYCLPKLNVYEVNWDTDDKKLIWEVELNV